MRRNFYKPKVPSRILLVLTSLGPKTSVSLKINTPRLPSMFQPNSFHWRSSIEEKNHQICSCHRNLDSPTKALKVINFEPSRNSSCNFCIAIGLTSYVEVSSGCVKVLEDYPYKTPPPFRSHWVLDTVKNCKICWWYWLALISKIYILQPWLDHYSRKGLSQQHVRSEYLFKMKMIDFKLWYQNTDRPEMKRTANIYRSWYQTSKIP